MRNIKQSEYPQVAQWTREAPAVVFGPEPTDVRSALRWMDAVITWHGYDFEGVDGDPLTLVTSFHWDTRAADMTPTLSRTQARIYDRNCEAAFGIIGLNIDDAYAVALNVQPCADCGRLIRWWEGDGCGWYHIDPNAAECFLHGSGPDA